MFTPEEIESMPIAIEKLFKDLQLRVMTDVVRRLTNVQDISASADYQMSRLYELGKSKEEIQRLVQETLDKSDEEIDSIFTDIIQNGYARDKQLYLSSGKDFIPYKENKPLQQLVKAMQKQTKDSCRNITQSMGFAVKQPDGKLAFKPIAQYYQDTLDKAVTNITSGAFDYNTVLNRTVSEMTNSGLRTVDYASGYSNRANVAARRAVMTGVRQVTSKISEDNAEKLETEYFEVSWHRGARPSHQEFQGKVYSRDGLVSVCGLGTVEGLGGANCYHSYDPFVMGISERKYTDEWLDEQNAKENTPVEYNGKEYTVYEATQRQRRLESTMRAQREKIRLLEEGNADEDSIIAAKARYFKTSDEYVRFSKAMDLPQQRERVLIDGNGVISNKPVAKPAESEFISDDWKGLKYPQRKKRSDFATDDEWQAFRKSYIEDFNKYNDDVDRIIKNHDSKVENITEKKFIKWAEERGIENVNIKGMSKTAMADFMSSYDSMIEKLPKAAGKLKSVDLVSTKGSFSINQKALAWSNNDTSIHFAKSHFSKDKYSDVLQQEILSCVTGLNPDGANPYLHTYQHEMGHLIEKWVGKEAGGVDKLKEEMFKIFEGNLPDISDYGNNHGYGEWFAEMTSSYLNGTKSEKVEKFGGVLKKYFGSPDIAKSAESGIIKSNSIPVDIQKFAKIPKEKFTKYALDPIKQPDKARAFKEALGYSIDNYQELIDNIKSNFNEKALTLKNEDKFGKRYELIMNLKGSNGKNANVCTAWIKEGDDSELRLTSAYVTKKKVKPDVNN